MATKKQRRRREKEHRHEYVWVDDEGNEIAPDGTPAKASSQGAKSAPTARGGRTVHPPSWGKSLKRGAIFAPIMLATVMLLSNNLTLAQQVTQTLFIVSIFVPFSYFLDRFFYRSFQKRQGKPSDGSRSRS